MRPGLLVGSPSIFELWSKPPGIPSLFLTIGQLIYISGTTIIILVSFLMWMTVAFVLSFDMDLAALLETPSDTIL
jgi:hypothetical protein